MGPAAALTHESSPSAVLLSGPAPESVSRGPALPGIPVCETPRPALPKIRDSWSYLYVEHCRIDQEDKAIAIHDGDGKTPVPCAVLCLLMLGPGVSITHAAIRTLADSGCLVMWCGEEAVRFYAMGMGETRSSRNLLAQARL